MAGRLSLHNQNYANFSSFVPADPPEVGPAVVGVTTDADTHSVLLVTTLSYENTDTPGYDSCQYYRVGTDDENFPVALGEPVGPVYRFSGITPPNQEYVNVIAVDPDPPACGAYTLCAVLGDGVLQFLPYAIIAFTF